MFIGHFAVGFAVKRAAPRASLGPLMLAPLFPDLLWPVFLLFGLEEVRIDPGNTAFTPLDFVRYPFTHSLAMALLWSLLVAFVYRARTGYAKGAQWIAIGVASHWVLDAVVHRPDLPLVPWSAARAGLGLWDHPRATVLVESALFAAGLALYLATTRARNRRGVLGLWAFVAALVLIYSAAATGPPPPDVRTIAIADLAGVLFVPWAWWIDRNRELRGRVAGSAERG